MSRVLAKLLKLAEAHTYPAHIEKFRQNPGFLGHWDISGTLVFQLFTATRRKGDVHTFPSLSILVCDHVCAATTFARRLYALVVADVLLRGISVRLLSCIVQSMFGYISHTHTEALRTLGFRGRIFCLSGGLVLRRTMILPDMRVHEEASHNKRGANRQCYEHHRGH